MLFRPIHACWPVLLALLGCAGEREIAMRDRIGAVPRPTLEPAGTAVASSGTTGVAPQAEALGTLGQYLAHAFAHSPVARAAHARWEASVHRITRARRLPEPVVSLGVFLRAVETRVGPQRLRLGIQQTFPWPTKLSAGSDASAAQAQAAAARFEATLLQVAAQVEDAYWSLWETRAVVAVRKQHLEVVRGLSETVRGRMATGSATLADQQQIDLTAARLEDGIHSLEESEQIGMARLRSAVGLSPVSRVPTREDPSEPSLPAVDGLALADALVAHPMVASYERMAESQEFQAEAEDADRLPSFTIGADWILTDEARMPGVPGSGKDAVIAGLGVRLPLWQGSYGDSASAARAEAISQRAERQAALNAAQAELEASLSALRDAARRTVFHTDTLLPQADAAYASVLGAYASGRGSVAQAVLAQRDLLDLRVELARARADHMRAWARLQQVVGEEVERAPYREPVGTRQGAPQQTGPVQKDVDHE